MLCFDSILDTMIIRYKFNEHVNHLLKTILHIERELLSENIY